MTDEDVKNTVLSIRKFFESIDLPFMLGGSMLKGIICTGRPYPTDSEVDFYIMADDVKRCWDKITTHPNFEMFPGIGEFKALYFREPTGLAACGAVHEHELGMYFNIVHGFFQCFPKEGFFPLKKYYWLNQLWNIPGNWLDIYTLFYGGKNWIEDRPDYHWKHSGTLIEAKSLDEMATKWKERIQTKGR